MRTDWLKLPNGSYLNMRQVVAVRLFDKSEQQRTGFMGIAELGVASEYDDAVMRLKPEAWRTVVEWIADDGAPR